MERGAYTIRLKTSVSRSTFQTDDQRMGQDPLTKCSWECAELKLTPTTQGREGAERHF